MIDREKVINGLEQIVNDPFMKARADYWVLVCSEAIALLKEQEAVEPKKVNGYNPPMYTIYEYECEKCKSPMMNKQPFCMGCGKQVKWE